MTSSSNTTVVTTILPAQEQAFETSLGIGLTVLMLAGKCSVAWLRSRGHGDDGNGRIQRIAMTALGFGTAFTLLLAAEWIWKHGRLDQLFPSSLISLLAATAIGFVLFSIAEFWLGLMRPRRTASWLIAAILAFVGLFLAALVAIFWLRGILENLDDPGMLLMLGLAAFAAITWWSCLPPPGRNVAQLFD